MTTTTASHPGRIFQSAFVATAAVGCLITAAFPACSDKFSSCEAHRNCPPSGGSGGASGESGSAGSDEDGAQPGSGGQLGTLSGGNGGGGGSGTGGTVGSGASETGGAGGGVPGSGGRGGRDGEGPAPEAGAGGQSPSGTGGSSPGCNDLQCLNDGKCVEDDEEVHCECAAGFDGEECEINLDDCPRNACLNGGTCVDGIESYSCRCTPAFTGRECETPRFEWVTPVDSSVTVQGISGDGRVVVGYVVADGTAPAKPFRWTSRDGLRYLGSYNGYARAVNFDGTVVVGCIDKYDGFDREAFRWTQQEGPVPLGGNDSCATAVSYDGNTIVGFSDTSAVNQTQVFRWMPGQFSELGTMLEGSSSTPAGISGDGTVFVGNAGYPGPTSNYGAAFRFAVNGFVRVGPEESRPSISAISGDGTVIVGTYYDAGLRYRTFRWTATAGFADVPLDTLLDTLPSCVNSDGTVMAGIAYSLSTWGWILHAQGGTRHVAELIAETGADVTDWSQIQPRAMSADGSVLVGTLRYGDAGHRSWVLRVDAH